MNEKARNMAMRLPVIATEDQAMSHLAIVEYYTLADYR
jgi:hypothetical protein